MPSIVALVITIHHYSTERLRPNISCRFFESLPLCCLELVHNLQENDKTSGKVTPTTTSKDLKPWLAYQRSRTQVDHEKYL
ncbi:hypothetical protein M758_3G169700 [Ceratodon purpureus]|nr:hypothetical protein M758_3G169700 [Ceratodon purpureus]